jgi:hypothetical protein
MSHCGTLMGLNRTLVAMLLELSPYAERGLPNRLMM